MPGECRWSNEFRPRVDSDGETAYTLGASDQLAQKMIARETY
jgi:hypothetical protein